MKPRQVNSSLDQSSCSCTSCLYKSESENPSFRRLVEGGTKIERLFYGKYLPLRERKLIEKLIKTRAVYDDVRNKILSRSNVSIKENTKKRTRDQLSADEDDDIERSSAIMEIVSIVDRGGPMGPKISECCSCCTCGSKSGLHDTVHRNPKRIAHYPTRSGSHLSSQSSFISKRRGREGRRSKSRGVQFKHIRSDPCTCTLKLGLSKPKVSSTSQHQESMRIPKGFVRKPFHRVKSGKAHVLSNIEEGTKKSVKKIRQTSSKIKKRCVCLEEKSIEKLKLAKYTVKEKLDSMQTQYVKRHETIPSFDELGVRNVKKDSITKFKEKLKRRKVECDHECGMEECVPEECLGEINLKSVVNQKNKIDVEEKDQQSPRNNVVIGTKLMKKVQIKAQKVNADDKKCTCTLALGKPNKAQVNTEIPVSSATHVTSTSTDRFKNTPRRQQKSNRNVRDKKRRTKTNISYQSKSASSGTTHSVSTLSTMKKTEPKIVRAERSAPNVSTEPQNQTSGTDKDNKSNQDKSILKATKRHGRQSQVSVGKYKSASTKYNLRRCTCTLKLTQAENMKTKAKRAKETSNQTIAQRYTSSSADTTLSKLTGLTPCDSECLDIRNRENIMKKRNKQQSTGARIITESKSTFSPKSTPHRMKKVQSSMFAYKTEVETKYRDNLRNSPDEINRKIPSPSGRPAVKISSSFSFNIEFSKERHPLNEYIEEQSRMEPSKESNKKKVQTKKTILKKNKDIDTKQINKGTRTGKKIDRLKCLCSKFYKKPKEKATVRFASTSTEPIPQKSKMPPVKVTKATKTKKNTLAPHECHPSVCTPGHCNPYECLELIKMRKETGTSVDSKRKRSSSSIANTIEKSKKDNSVCVCKPRHQPTISFTKEARKPLVIRNVSREVYEPRRQSKPVDIKKWSKESNESRRQIVRIGSSFSFNIEFSKTTSYDDEMLEKPGKESYIESTEKVVKSLHKTTETKKPMLKCFCKSVKTKTQEAATNVFAVNKLIHNKNKVHLTRNSVIFPTNLQSAGSSYGFNFKEMQSYFEKQKDLSTVRSFHKYRRTNSDFQNMNEIDLKHFYTFSEGCFIKSKRQFSAVHYNHDRLSYNSFSTIMSKSDITGVSSLLKRCFYTMNIEWNAKGKRAYKLKPYECEPGICEPGDCNPYECQKLIQKRLMRKSSKSSGASIGSKTVTSNTLRSTSREIKHQTDTHTNRHRPQNKKPRSGIQYKSSPQKAHKQAVRIGSTFSFNIEFSKDKLHPEDHINIVEKKTSRMRSRPAGTMHRGYRTEGTGIGHGITTADRHLQSGIRSRDAYSNTDKRLKRCFCTLKLQSDRTNLEKSSYVAMKEIRKQPTTSTTSQNTRPYRNERPRRRLDPNKCEPGTCVPGQCNPYECLETSQNTRPYRNERPRRRLDPNECEPGTCVPDQCNPYECLEKIKMRNKNTRDFGSGLEHLPRRSTSSITSSQKPQLRGKNLQYNYREKPVRPTISTITHSESPEGKPSKQAVRIGSTFSFHIEFYKDRISPETKPVKISYPRSTLRTSSKSIGQLGTKYKGRGVQGHRGLRHRDSQAGKFGRTTSTMTTSLLKRCFCTAKLQGMANIPKAAMAPVPKTETEIIQTDKAKVKKLVPRNISPYECPPGICVPGPGECDPYACLRKIKQRNKLIGNDMVRSKSTYSNTKSPTLKRGRKVQHKEKTHPKYNRETKRLPGSSKRNEYKVVPTVSAVYRGRQAVRIGSTFSFDVEFYKNRSPHVNKIQETARKLKHKSQKTSNKEHKKHRGVKASNTKMYNHMSQISGTSTTDRGVTAYPKRCFCTLKLQKRSKFSTANFGKIPPNAPNVVDRGITARNKVYGRKYPTERSYKLKPYECEPGVCTPDECDPNECLLRIQRRNMKQSGTMAKYPGNKSASSLASMASTASRRVQYGTKPPRTTESARITHKPKARTYRSIPQRQAVRVGSSYSFNVEFYKDKSFNESNPRAKVIKMRESVHSDKSSMQGIGSKHKTSQNFRQFHHKDSQSLMPKMRSSMTDAQFLKRCFCTLKLQKSKNINPPLSARNQKVYLATMHNLSPYECEPGFCIPNQCDPYECQKRIQQRMKHSKFTGMKKPNVRSSSNSASTVQNYTRSIQRSPSTNAKKVHSTQKRRKSLAIKNQRQELKLGSSFNFNIEFYRDKNASDTQDSEMLGTKSLPTKSKTANTYINKENRTANTIYDRGNDMDSQVDIAKTQSKGVGPLSKSCFCTLKLQKLGRNQQELLQKGKVIQTSKNSKQPLNNMASVGTSAAKKNKKEKVDVRDMAVKTQTKRSYKLKPYECEPGVCTPGYCDPNECLERIKRREMRDYSTNTKNKKREKFVEAAGKRETFDSGQQYRHKKKDFNQKTVCPPKPSKVTLKNANLTDSRPGRQVVSIGSSFSFNISFYKDPGIVPDQEPIITKSIKVRDRKEDVIQPRKANKKLSYIETKSKFSKECQNCPNTECRGTGMGPFLKRCFCTLKLQNPNIEKKSKFTKTKKYNNSIAPTTGIKLETRNKKLATKRWKPPKQSIDYSKLEPYECEPGFCVAGQCDPYVCLERIQQRNMKNKKTGTNIYQTQKSAYSVCPPYCSKTLQTDMNPTKTNESYQNTDKIVEESRFQKFLDNQQGVKYGSNVSFNIEFYKERLDPDFNKIKAVEPSNVIPTKNQTQYVKPKKDNKKLHAEDRQSSTAMTQSDGIKLENKRIGVVNSLKRCFCTLNLQKGAQRPDKQKNVTVNRIDIGDIGKPFHNIPQEPLERSLFGNTTLVYRAENVDFNKSRDGRNTQVLYPYIPRKFNKNTSKTMLGYENNLLDSNKKHCLKKLCDRPQNIFSTLNINGTRVRKLTAKHSEYAIKVNSPSGFRSFMGRCKKIVCKRIKESKISDCDKKDVTTKTNPKFFKLKSTPQPNKNINGSKKNRQNSYDNKIICSYCQIKYDNEQKIANPNFSLIIRPNQNFVGKERIDKSLNSGFIRNTNNETKRNCKDSCKAINTGNQMTTCKCDSTCKCEKCTGDWRTMIAEQREARRAKASTKITSSLFNKCINAFKINLLKSDKPPVDTLIPDKCARCCGNKDHLDPKSICQGIIRPKLKKVTKKKSVDVVEVKQMRDNHTDICTCKLPCPCKKCHRNATFSNLTSGDEVSPQKYLLICDVNHQTTLAEAGSINIPPIQKNCSDSCSLNEKLVGSKKITKAGLKNPNNIKISKNNKKVNSSKTTQQHRSASCTCEMPCPCPNNFAGKQKQNVKTKKVTGISTSIKASQLNSNIFNTSPHVPEITGGQINVGHDTKIDSKSDPYKKKLEKKRQKLEKKKQELLAKHLKREEKMLDQETLTPIHKQPGDLCSCRLPCLCGKKPTKLNVKELTCDNNIYPQKYLLFSEGAQDGQVNIEHYSAKHEEKQRKLEKKRQKQEKKERERFLKEQERLSKQQELLAKQEEQEKLKKLQEKTTQVKKIPGDLCSCQFPCPCGKKPTKLNVKELTCDNNVHPQKYLLFSGGVQDGQVSIEHYSAKDEEKQRKLEKKRQKQVKKQQERLLKEQERLTQQQELLAKQQEQEKLKKLQVKTTQVKKQPGDLCSCQFPCPCGKVPANLNVKELTCGDNVFPQKYLLLSGGAQDGQVSIEHYSAKEEEKQRKQEKKRQKQEKKEQERLVKAQERLLKEQERLAKNQEREKMKKLQEKTTQVKKQPGDLCSCQFPCPCEKTPTNLNVKELTCGDNVFPQKYLLLSGGAQDGQVSIEHYSAKDEEKQRKLEKKRQKQEKKEQERLVKEQERLVKEQELLAKKQEREELKKIQIKTTQTQKPPGDLCSCKFPCSCQKTPKKVKVSELACSDWPSPHKYLLVTDTLQTDSFEADACKVVESCAHNANYISSDNIKQDIKNNLVKAHKREIKKQEEINRDKQKSDNITQMPKPDDTSGCQFQGTCRKPVGNLKVSELTCSDWPSPEKYLLFTKSGQMGIQQQNGNTINNQNKIGGPILTSDEICQFNKGTESVIGESKNNKTDKKKEKKQKQSDIKRIHKRRSDLCTCKIPCSCQKSTKNISEFSCGDSKICPNYLHANIETDMSKHVLCCQKCKINTDVIISSKDKMTMKNQKYKHRSDLCTCKLPDPCKTCNKEINISELSHGDWPSPQKKILGNHNYQFSMPSNIQADIPEETVENLSTIPTTQKRKIKKLNKKLKKNYEQQTPKYQDDLCICKFPCPCQKCPKTLDVTEFSLEDWPSPRRCLLLDGRENVDNSVNFKSVKANEVCSKVDCRYKTGAKFELLPNKRTKPAKSLIGNLFGKPEKDKEPNHLQKAEPEEKVTRKKYKEPTHLQKSEPVETATPKKDKEPNHLQKVEPEEKTTPKNLVKNKVGSRFKKYKDKFLPVPCICGDPVCKEEMKQMRRKPVKKREKICVCGVPTCVQKIETTGTSGQPKSKNNKSEPDSTGSPKSKSKGKKSYQSEPQSKYKSSKPFSSDPFRGKKSNQPPPPSEEQSSKPFSPNPFRGKKSNQPPPPSEEQSSEPFSSNPFRARKSNKPPPPSEGKSSKPFTSNPFRGRKSDQPPPPSEGKSSKPFTSNPFKGRKSDQPPPPSEGKSSKPFSSNPFKRKKAIQPEPEPKSKSLWRKSKPVSEPGSKSKKSGSLMGSGKSKNSKLKPGQLATGKKSPKPGTAKFHNTVCLCNHTCLCDTLINKPKPKPKPKVKPKSKTKQKPKKKVSKKKKPVKHGPGPCERCRKSIARKWEQRQRRAARRRKIKLILKHARKTGIALCKNVNALKKTIAATPAAQSVTNTLEQHYVSNFILNARDPKKRFRPKVKKGKEPIDFECSLFMGSLRRRPWISVYYLCPWFYPHCISFLNIWKQFTDIILFLLAVGVWSPCILGMELCRAFVCCAFCTG